MFAVTMLGAPMPGLPAVAFAQDFSAKTVNLVIGFGAGGGYDLNGRLLARHLGRHLPGQPTVVVQNMPGGGSLNLANVTANTAPADGSHIALMNSAAALEPVMGNPAAKFEAGRFHWIGNMNREAVGCAAWTASGVATWNDVAKRGARFGGVGAAGTSSQHAYFLKNVLKAPITVITGFRGSNEVNLALQRGEAEVTCGLFLSSMRGPYRQDYEAGKLSMVIQFGKQREPYFNDAVSIYDLVKTEQDRQLAEFVFGQAEISRPLALPPATPPGVVTAMRRAFDLAMKDPALLADAEKSGLSFAPMSGEETQKDLARFAAVSSEVAKRARDAIRP
jgi:tripartite-type tricarboxylate transporter receptor subunit TctC